MRLIVVAPLYALHSRLKSMKGNDDKKAAKKDLEEKITAAAPPPNQPLSEKELKKIASNEKKKMTA